MKKQLNSLQSAQDPSYPLISRARTDKLDLLRHLTANLARTVVVCGPDGVGKTYLLKLYQSLLPESSILCALGGDSSLNLENIQEQLKAAIAAKNPSFASMPLAESLERLPSSNGIILLVIDDAGKLAPGILEQIILYAADYPAFRAVFALTHNDMYLKNSTDAAVDDCYQIEIPSLTELQCADFLEYLSTLPNPRVDFNAINEEFVAYLYRETYGIPGRILEKLPKPRKINKLDYSAPLLTCAVIGLIAIALGVQWWSSKHKPAAQIKTLEEKQANQQTAGQQPDTAKVQAQPQAQPALAQNPNVANDKGALADSQNKNGSTTDTNIAANALAQPNASVNSGDKIQQPQMSTTQDKVAEIPTTTMPTVAQNPPVLDDGGRWVMDQPTENITLQLMALSDKETIMAVMQRHQALGQNLRYLKTITRRGKDRYVLLYGSFSTSDEANVEARKLPNELRKPWVRKMTSIQAELNPPSAPSIQPAIPPTPTVSP